MASVVQSKNGYQGSNAAVAVTFNSSTTSGNKIIACVYSYGAVGNPGTTSVTDNKSNTYTRRANGSGGTTTHTAIFESNDSPTMGATHTVTFSGGDNDGGMAILEVTGLDASPFDKSAILDHTSTSTPATAATATLTQADEWCVAIVDSDQGNTDTITPGGIFTGGTIIEDENGTTVHAFNVCAATVASTTAVTASWTLAGAHDCTASLVTFKASAGGPAFIAPPSPQINQTVNRARYF